MPGVLFDARVLRPGMTGIGIYARNLLRALPEGTRVGILLPSGSPFATDFPGARIHFTRIPLTAHPLTELYEQVALPFLCKSWGYDRFVSFEGRVPAFGFGLKSFAFLYDLAYATIPGTHGWRYASLLRVAHATAARRARILTISETVKKEIAEYFRLPPRRVGVVYPADSGLAGAPSTPPARAANPYVLSVGMTNPRKNLRGLLAGFGIARGERPSVSLVLTGRTQWIDEEIRVAKANGVINKGFVTEGDLKDLYEGAAVFAFASLDEGFGIPLLDAALFGVPIACSDIPVFREILGDGAEYFDPNDPASISRAVLRALDAGRRPDPETLRQRFSWERSARDLLRVIGSDASDPSD